MSVIGDRAVPLPRELNIAEFVAARANEMKAMAKAACTITSNMKAMQMLPNNMRRRAASHNVKRLPRRLRNAALHEMQKSGNMPAKKKVPSRKHRRRPSNLLAEYNRRQKTNVWLETHIWHAKRFHMIDLWGYKIPRYPNERGVRSIYRSCTQKCVAWDLSYLCCIEVEGLKDDIVKGLNQLTNTATGPTFDSMSCLGGNREGSVTMYQPNSYPYNCIGKVNYMWKPDSDLNGQRTLWIWVHPSYYKPILGNIVQAFGAIMDDVACKGDTSVAMETGEDAGNKTTADASLIIIDDIEPEKGGNVDPKNTVDSVVTSQNKSAEDETSEQEKSFMDASMVTIDDVDWEKDQPNSKDSQNKGTAGAILNPEYSNGSVTMRPLKDTLNRFRLTGPWANRVVSSILSPADIGSNDSNDKENVGEIVKGDAGTSNGSKNNDKEPDNRWWREYYNRESECKIFEAQCTTLKSLSNTSAAMFPPHCVLGVTVMDPRINMPKTPIDPPTASQQGPNPPDVPEYSDSSLSTSPLWSKHIRSVVKNTKMTDHEMNKRRSQCLVPGSTLNLGDEGCRVPVILIQNPGQDSLVSSVTPGLCSGWDVILPAGWSMPFWVAASYGRVIHAGLRDSQAMDFHQGIHGYPHGHPDTEAGCIHAESERKQHQDKYNRIPKAKRPNYRNFGSLTPFHCPWSVLVKDWATRASTDAGNTMETDNAGQENDFYVLRERKALQNIDTLVSNTSHMDQTFALRFKNLIKTGDMNCVVGIEILVKKGTPEPNSMICIPTEKDMKCLSSDPNASGPSEHSHKNKDEEVKQQEDFTTVETVIASCSRDVIGYLTEGGFCYAKGSGKGVGYVALHGLAHLASLQVAKCNLTVLIRVPNSFQYRFAKMSVMK